ncbi:MAG: hypothetical protein COA76_08210 [Moritella sp.]|nr:MAG: hypothetical protein COA76_08210 [Moritella sp.]
MNLIQRTSWPFYSFDLLTLLNLLSSIFQFEVINIIGTTAMVENNFAEGVRATNVMGTTKHMADYKRYQNNSTIPVMLNL